MFSHFTASARRVMQRAFREAKRCQHDFVGTEHLLYGLLCDHEGPAALLLRTLNARPELMLEKVELSLQRHEAGLAMERFPLSPASKRVFRAASDEAGHFNHQMVGPEHLLLGVLCDSECEAAQILAGHGVTLTMVRGAAALIPPDSYEEARIRAENQPRVTLGDNPTVDDLEQWIAPAITSETITETPLAPYAAMIAPEPPQLEGQLRRTQMFLGGCTGFLVACWLVDWRAGIVVALVGLLIAWINNAWVSVICCTGLSLILIRVNIEQEGKLTYASFLVAIPLGILFGTFLSDLWRFALPAGEVGHPVKPSGVPVDADTRLALGSIVLAPSQGRWYRAQIVALELGDKVRVRFVGWPAGYDETVPRSELQIDPGIKREAR